jgi:predicted NUDIX family NTP pyrophosphohydrolase
MKQSAGLLPYRRKGGMLEVFLVHPGGPFWAKKDDGAWSLAKGEYTQAEDPLDAAKREFQEETGFAIDGVFIPLGEVKQAGGKLVTAWAVESDLDPATVRSNTFSLEWPPKSGKLREFPEIDRSGWFTIEHAGMKLLPSQTIFLDRLVAKLQIAPDRTR